MLQVKVFSNVPEELLGFRVRDWLDETFNKTGVVDIISTSQSQDGEYVTLTIFYKL